MPPQNGGVQFENQGEEFGRPPERASAFDLTGMLVQWGVVSSRQQAEYVLIGIGVFAFAVAIFIYFGSSGSSSVPMQPNYGNAS